MHPSPSQARHSLLRLRSDGGKVEMVELFFDLVFVFAITQLSHGLLAELSGTNTLRIGVLLLAVWWVWICTSWATNWLDPNRPPVRSMLFVLMLVGLVLSASIPEAFGSAQDDKGWAFALAYVLMQVGRTLFTLWAVRGERQNLVRNFQRIIGVEARQQVLEETGRLPDVVAACIGGAPSITTGGAIRNSPATGSCRDTTPLM